MARNTAEPSSVVPVGDAGVDERTSRRSPACVSTSTTQPRSVTNGADAGVEVSFGLRGDLATNPETGDWFDLFPVEGSSQVPNDPAPLHQIGNTGRAGTLMPFDHSSSATASHFYRGVRRTLDNDADAGTGPWSVERPPHVVRPGEIAFDVGLSRHP